MKPNRSWILFFRITVITTVLLLLITIVSTSLLNASIPDDCPSCGMATVGLAPLWLLTIASAVTLFIGVILRASLRMPTWGRVMLVVACLVVILLLLGLWVGAF
jgi:hypothetical protein